MGLFKKQSFIILLLLGITAVIFNIYLYGLVNQTKLEVGTHKNSLDLIAQENTLLKDQVNNLKAELKDQQNKMDAQKEMVAQAQAGTEKINSRLDSFTEQVQGDLARIEKESKDQLKDIQAKVMLQESAMTDFRDGARQWQKDYVSVLANLEKITKNLEEKIKSTRLDLTGKITLIDAQLNKLNKMFSNPDPAAKPMITRTRLGNDPFGLQDITDKK